jgi:hypothetical protein
MPVERPLSDEELGMAVMLKTSRFSWSFFVESIGGCSPNYPLGFALVGTSGLPDLLGARPDSVWTGVRILR